MVNIKINNLPIQVEEGTTILDAAKQAGIKIPTLCYLRDINAIGACRVCVVEVKGARSLVASCVYPVFEGMEVFTNTQRVLESRKKTLELLLSDHKQNCLSCDRNQKCELQALALEYNCDSFKYEGEKSHAEYDDSTAYTGHFLAQAVHPLQLSLISYLTNFLQTPAGHLLSTM